MFPLHTNPDSLEIQGIATQYNSYKMEGVPFARKQCFIVLISTKHPKLFYSRKFSITYRYNANQSIKRVKSFKYKNVHNKFVSHNNLILGLCFGQRLTIQYKI